MMQLELQDTAVLKSVVPGIDFGKPGILVATGWWYFQQFLEKLDLSRVIALTYNPPGSGIRYYCNHNIILLTRNKTETKDLGKVVNKK
jgi:hypothetical protein